MSKSAKYALSDKIIDKVSELSEMIGNLKELSGERIVIKCGGELMDDENFLESLGNDIAILRTLGISVVVVHGAGSQVDRVLAKLKIKNDFFDGYRITDSATIEVVEMALTGLINKNFVKYLLKHEVNCIGLSGKDNNLITAKKIRRTQKDEGSNIERIIDLGFIGDPADINLEFFEDLLDNADLVPVISPIAFDKSFNTFSINADVLACYIAENIKATKVIIMSENYNIKSKDGIINGHIKPSDVNRLIENTTDYKMILRLKASVNALKNGVEAVHIISSEDKHSLLAELSSLNDTTSGIVICDNK
ncbi:acetylglutamate kinase [Candidatus Deianiraea vastatrix]|uniref:Acetylglutamate kinase n=1 Tax=Candidatus Deianiraea vastatrix TaxID=2163644 RepID=A0A5B8XDY3_9RICK|nr:acetylglutamate kinase [Candidatus Deianiraea vastatrix]QED23075.1 Acetylglutamate kinase [Candidatus Deianiraea vastatrix]